MSALTPCNYCTLRDMRRRAQARGVDVSVDLVVAGELQGWTSARFSDEDEPVAWFMVLPESCAC